MDGVYIRINRSGPDRHRRQWGCTLWKQILRVLAARRGLFE